MSTDTVEPENPDVKPTEEAPTPPMVLGEALLERWMREGKEAAIDKVDTLVEVLERLRKASIRATYASDWIVHTSRDGDGNIVSQRGYLQDIGADRAGPVWGIEISAPVKEREDHPDKTFSYHLLADAWSKVTGQRRDNLMGSRWSGDQFFSRSKGADEKVDPTDVLKSAYSNLHGGAVRRIAGLGGVPLETLRECGIDIAKVVHVDYVKGAKGGESTGASMGATGGAASGPQLNFGRAKGKRVSELSDKDLAWYTKAVSESVADPSKAAYKDRNETLLAALHSEPERRKQAAAVPPPAAAAPTADAPAAAPTRGQRQGALLKKLTAFKDVRSGALLKQLIGKENVSELTDEELADVEAMTDEVLRDAVMAIVEHE